VVDANAATAPGHGRNRRGTRACRRHLRRRRYLRRSLDLSLSLGRSFDDRDIYGAREVGMTTVMFNSDQGTKDHLDCVPDYTINDHRELLTILRVPGRPEGEV
jgi:hypothetical protein